MSLTVKDILEKTFKRSFKGYDENEVDKFLDQIIDEYKALESEIASLKSELKVAKERVGKVKETEEAIMRTMVSAQRSSERMLNEAARKAELVIDNAENTARRREEQTTRALAETEKKMEEVKTSAHGFAASFANMINATAASFEQTYKSYFGNSKGMFGSGINIDALARIDHDITISMKDMTHMTPIEPEKIEPEPETIELEPETASMLEPELASELETQTLSEREPKKSGLMELQEINKMLSDIEREDEVLLDSEELEKPEPDQNDELKTSEFGTSKPKYDDYSWLYENEDTQDDSGYELSFKDPKEKEELKSLIDEIIE